MKTIAVLGGTGVVGRSVCEKLVERSSTGRIVVPTRRLPHGQRVRSLPTVELLEADVHDDRQLAGALAGVDAVVNLVAILHGSPSAFEHVSPVPESPGTLRRFIDGTHVTPHSIRVRPLPFYRVLIDSP